MHDAAKRILHTSNNKLQNHLIIIYNSIVIYGLIKDKCNEKLIHWTVDIAEKHLRRMNSC